MSSTAANSAVAAANVAPEGRDKGGLERGQIRISSVVRRRPGIRAMVMVRHSA